MPIKLHSRLLYLCDFLYGVVPGVIRLPDQTASERTSAIGLQATSTAIGRNALFTGMCRDLALVGRLPEGIVIAVRGTQPPQLTSNLTNALSIAADWLNDGVVVGVKSEEYGGFIEEGFCDSASALLTDSNGSGGIATMLEALVGPGPYGGRLILTGHSKGGPVAQMIAFLLRQEARFANSQIEVVTFAAARLGDDGFKGVFDRASLTCTRYETHDDIVPHLPLNGTEQPLVIDTLRLIGANVDAARLGFVSLGNAIVESAEAAAQLDNDDQYKASSVLSQFLGHALEPLVRIIAAHSIRPGSHYEELVTNNGIV